MKKILTICAMIAGAFTVMVGTTSCNKDNECCEWTDDYGDTYKYCEDDDLPAGATWSLVQAASESYDGSCD